MSEETGATDQVTTAEPEGATANATPPVQQAETTATAEQPQINWDDPQNPYRAFKDQFEGTRGALQQQSTENRRLREQMALAQEQLAALQAQQRAAAEQAERQRLEQMLEGDPEELQRSLKERLQQQRALEEWQAKMIPEYQRQAAETARRQYAQFISDTAQDWGLSQTDVQAISQEHGQDYGTFRKALAAKVREKHVSEANKDVEARIKAATEALKLEILGQQHAAEKSPDTGAGTPEGANSDREFLREFNAGRSNDYKRAREVLARL